MPITMLTTVYPRKREFWSLVEQTMERIFQVSPLIARQLAQEMNGAPEEEQLVFYHTEPLDVAADVLDKTPTSKEVHDYRLLAQREGWQ
jgi:hypothetical protein